MQKSKLDWLGLKWSKQKSNGLVLLTLSNQKKDYYKKAEEESNIVTSALEEITKLRLFSSKPLIQVALFPEEIFAEKTKIPFKWGTGCIRSTDKTGSNVFCCKYFLDRPITPYSSRNPEGKRGIIHEVLHTFLSQELNYSKFPRAINEGFCEYVPRILLKLQKGLIESKNYLDSFNIKESVRFSDIDTKGMAYFSDEKIMRHRGYASAFLGTYWLINQFSKGRGPRDSTRNFLRFLKNYHDSDNLYHAILQKTSFDIKTSKKPILEGLKLIK